MYIKSRSTHRKLPELNARIMREKPDIIATKETWLQTEINNAELNLYDYVLLRRDRVNRRGGDVIVYTSSSLNSTFTSLPADAEATDRFEAIYCGIHQHCSSMPLLVIYRSTSAS